MILDDVSPDADLAADMGLLDLRMSFRKATASDCAALRQEALRQETSQHFEKAPGLVFYEDDTDSPIN